jgi:hypothetical protein
LKPNASNQPGLTRRKGLGAILLLVLSLFLSPAARSQEAVPVEQLKAAFLYNFVRLVEWPTNAFAADSTPITIGVIAGEKDKFATDLATLLKDKKAHNRPIIVKRLSAAPDAASCQVVFVADGESRRMPQITDATHKKPILLIGEGDDFLDNGGMINILQDERQKRLLFDLNPQAAEECGLTVSSHLRLLARKTTPPKKAGGAE